ncbi:MAG: DNA glycosylase [Verrucomicrobiota bacterium]
MELESESDWECAGRIKFSGEFDLSATLSSGQVFHWLPKGKGWVGCVGSSLVGVRQSKAEELLVLPSDQTDVIRHYFRLDEDQAAIFATFPRNDAFFWQAVESSPGLRIIRQPLWECLATFLTSSLKQVAHIQGISLALRAAIGEEHHAGWGTGFSYPEPRAVSEAGESELRKLGLGYRAKSVALAAEELGKGNLSLETGRTCSSDEELREFLCQFHGVGRKIAHCVMLFGYGRMQAFPVDVWIERILRHAYYQGDPSVKASEMEIFAGDHFGPYAGYAQQFLFHHARVHLGKDLEK